MDPDQGIPLGVQAANVNRVQELENRRDAITQLYWDEDRDLPEVMIIMETQYRFQATNRQYKSAFKRWGLQKHVSSADMRNLVRIRKRRHHEHNKPTKFFVNKRHVPVEKIDRWIQRTGFQHRIEMSDANLEGETPPSIDYQTPSDYQSVPNTPEVVKTPAAETIRDPNTDSQPWPTSMLEFNVESHSNLATNGSFNSTPISTWNAGEWFTQQDAAATVALRPTTHTQEPELRRPFGFSLMPSSPSVPSIEILAEAPTASLFENLNTSRVSRETNDMQQSEFVAPIAQNSAPQRSQILHDEVWIDVDSRGINDPATPKNVDRSLNKKNTDDTFVIIDRDDFESQIFILDSEEWLMGQNEETLGRHLRSAASRGDGPSVQKILATRRVDVDHCSTAGRTALQNAAFSGHNEIIEALVTDGADIFFRATNVSDLVDGYHSTAVELAINANWSSSLHTLLSAFFRLNGPTDDYHQEIREAINYAMDREQLTCLIVIVRYVNWVGGFNWSDSVNYAVRKYHLEAIQLFIENKVDVDVSSIHGPILHSAIMAYRPDFPISFAVIKSLVGTVSLRTEDAEGRKAIHLAASCACDEVIGLLLENDVDPDTEAGDGRTPFLYLQEAVFQRRNPQRLANCIQLLTDAGAELNAKDKQGKTLLHHAPALAKHLVMAGANPNAQDVQGKSPLYAAIRSGKGRDVRVLLSCLADPNQRVRGKPLLFAAVAYHYPEIVRILIEGGADVNAKDDFGQTALYQASQEGSQREVEALLDCGADPNICKSEGWPPILIAIKYDYLDIVRLLLKGGADANIKALGATPLYVAKVSSSDPAILKLLLDYGARDDVKFKYPEWENELEAALALAFGGEKSP